MNGLLAVCHLLLRGAHFTGGLLGGLGHVLHGVSHFVDRGGHLVHLQRLLGAVLLRGTGVVADMPGGPGQGMGRALQLADHALQLAIEAVEVLAQVGDFVTAVSVQASSQVAFSTGDVAHGLHCFLQRAGDAARNQHDHQRHQQGDGHAHQRGVAQLAGEFGLHVIDVHA